MQYLILNNQSEEYAQAISRFIYAMSRPNLDGITQYFWSWITHPITNEIALCITDDDIPIHPEANANLLVDLIRSQITEQEAEALESLINQGGRVKPAEHIPNSLIDNLKTEEEFNLPTELP